MGSMSPRNYQHIIVRGLPYDRGFSHGQQAKAKILASIKHYAQPGKLPPRETCLRCIKEVYIPGIEIYFPEALAEMRGIADGADVALDEIMILNARYDLARIRGSNVRPYPLGSEAVVTSQAAVEASCENDGDLQECTAAGFLAETTSSSEVVLAQNWDMSANVFINDTALYLEVHPDPAEGLPNMFLTTEAGQLGRSGFNSAGLGVSACSLMSTEDFHPISRTGKSQPMLPMSLTRRQFLHNSSFSDGLVNIKCAPRHVSNRLIVATAENFVMNLEITPSNVYLSYPEPDTGFVVGANHFTNPAFFASGRWVDRMPGGSTWFRDVQVARAARRALKKKPLSDEDITNLFCDHLSAPSSVCQHMENCTVRGVPDYPYTGRQITLAHVRYNLTKRTATVCKGPPCMGVFDQIVLAKA